MIKKVSNLGECRLVTAYLGDGYETRLLSGKGKLLVVEFHFNWQIALTFHNNIVKLYHDDEYEEARNRLVPQQSLDLGNI